ncbi:MAG: right-handed parallel beta-helix repeat-containing protein [Phycisphaerae bacterium]|nr:right-handed parallel beta-helix repeat-containing protein [Phycisphaerae bacterium]
MCSGRLVLISSCVVLAWVAGCAAPGAGGPGGAPISAEIPQADFYVATNGNDAWSGRLAVPKADGTDGPFATIARARDAVLEHRLLRRQMGDVVAPKPYTVLVRSGRYRLSEPIVFRPEDSGLADAPITYAAYPGEKPVFSGGKVVTGWKRNAGAVWTARIPEVEAGQWYPKQLFVNGERRTRARTPNEGYLRTDGPLPWIKDYRDRKSKEVRTGFRYKEGDLKRWDRLEDVNLFIYHSWTASMNWIASLDEPNRVVRFTAPTGWPIGYWERNQRYVVENALELLDSPGEWYLPRDTGVVNYWPMPGEDMTQAEVVVPMVRKLVVFDGDPKARKIVKHIHLHGLTFEHADWWVKDRGPADGQAAAWLEAAVFARGTYGCEIEDCTVRHVGEYGIYFQQGCQDNRIVRCHVHDLGAGGVRLGYMSGDQDQDLVSLRNTVDNCFIHHGGYVFPAGIGMWVGRSSFNKVTHNEISNFDYTGISVGWSWGYAPTSAHHNAFEYNNVHHIGRGVLSDMGGIYSLGISPGTVVRNNIFHDIYSYAYGGWGLYTDEGSTEIVMENNLVYNTKTGGFHQHYGRENVVRNNILAFSREGQVQRSREEEHLSFTFERNIVYFDNGYLLSSNWRNNKFKMDYNCYWDTSDPEISFAGNTLTDWQAKGFDKHSIIADPLFVDAEKFDFRLKPESPAIKLGFKPIDASRAGLYGEDEWTSLPGKFKDKPSEVPPRPQPRTISDGFEETGVGATAAGAATSGETDKARIRVCEDKAATGKRSLKFVDTPGLKQGFNPHLHYDPHLRTGTITGSFDIYLEPGATLYHEWRDMRGQPYRVGPSITINADGTLLASQKPVMKLPTGKWIHIAITCGAGKQSAGTYDLTVTVAGQAAKRFEKQPNGSKAFRRLDWYGFVPHLQTNCVFYVDNVSVHAE